MCWGVTGVEVLGSRMLLGGGEEVLGSSSGGQEEDEEEVWWSPQSSELLLRAESERCLWAESLVLSATSIFLSNTFLVS